MPLLTLLQISAYVTETGGGDGFDVNDFLSGFPFPELLLKDGSTAGKANKRGLKKVTLGSGASFTIDLNAGNFTDPRGNVLNLTRIVILGIYNAGTVEAVDIVRVGNAAANPFPLSSSATATMDIGPGGARLFVEPSAAGLAVGAGASDQLKLLNLGTNSINVYIFAVGS